MDTQTQTSTAAKQNQFVKVISIAEQKDFDYYFKNYYQEAKENNHSILIKHYHFLSKNLEALQTLHDGSVEFVIEDYPKLNREGLGYIIEHLKLERKAFGQQISEKLRKRTEAGLHVGNPDITKKAKELASLQRIRLALFDPINIDMAKRIAQARGLKHNFNAIANDFNDQGLTSRRGGKFYAKSVERIFKRYQAVEGNYQENPFFSPLPSKAEAKGMKLSGLKTDYEFEDQIQFYCSISDLEKVDIQINIYDWQSQQAIYSNQHFDASNNRFFLSIEKTLILLPGQHYLELIGPNQERMVYPFVIAPSILKLIQTPEPV